MIQLLNSPLHHHGPFNPMISCTRISPRPLVPPPTHSRGSSSFTNLERSRSEAFNSRAQLPQSCRGRSVGSDLVEPETIPARHDPHRGSHAILPSQNNNGGGCFSAVAKGEWAPVSINHHYSTSTVRKQITAANTSIAAYLAMSGIRQQYNLNEWQIPEFLAKRA